MKYSDIKYFDIANGEGVRTSLFVSGCTNHCKGCFNPQTWDFNYGKDFTEETINTIVESLDKPFIKGLSLLGGDPMHPNNQKDVLNLILEVRKRLPKKDIWMWSGYTLEELMNSNLPVHTKYTEDILKNIDYLVDGRFIEERKVFGLQYRGSDNQRIIKNPLEYFEKQLTL